MHERKRNRILSKDILEQEKRKNEILKWELALISHQRNNTLKQMEKIK